MKKILPRLIFFVIFAGIFIYLFLNITEKPFGFDVPILEWFKSMHSSLLTKGFEFLTYFANTETIIVLCLVLLFIPATRWFMGLPLTIFVAIGAGICHVIKNVVERARPDESFFVIPEDGFSFPSGHTNGALVFYFFLGLLILRHLYAKRRPLAGMISLGLCILLILGVAVSRLYLGVHYPSDVLASLCLGSSLLIVLVTAYDVLYPVNYRITKDEY